MPARAPRTAGVDESGRIGLNACAGTPSRPASRRHEDRPRVDARRAVPAPRPPVAALRLEDPRDRAQPPAGTRHARLHRGRPLHLARLDRVDARLPVRLGPPAVRRHRRQALPRDRPARDARGHGRPPDRHGRPRPRVHDRQHLRQPPAADAGGADPAQRVGAALLRDGAQVLGGGAGAPLDAARRARGVHPLVQRAALAVRGHDAHAARAGRRPPPGPGAARGGRRAGVAARAPRAPRSRDGHLARVGRRRARRLRRARPRDARGDLQHPHRGVSVPQLAAGLLAVHHLDARPRLGHAAASPSSSSSWRPFRAARAGRRGRQGGRRSVHAAGRLRRVRPLPRGRRGGRHPVLGLGRARLAAASATTARSRPIRSTSSSRWTVRRRRSRRRGCCAWGTTCVAATPPAGAATGRRASRWCARSPASRT